MSVRLTIHLSWGKAHPLPIHGDSFSFISLLHCSWAASLEHIDFDWGILSALVLLFVGIWCVVWGLFLELEEGYKFVALYVRERPLWLGRFASKVNAWKICWLDPLGKDSASGHQLYLTLLFVNKDRWLLLWFHLHLFNDWLMQIVSFLTDT